MHSKFFYIWLITSAALAQEGNERSSRIIKQTAFEEWSSISLPGGSYTIGSVSEFGVGHGVAVGTDPAALSLGIRTGQIKWQLPFFTDSDRWALGLKAAWFNRKTLFSESVRNHFDELDGRFFRPSIVWSNVISPRLTIHTMWATGIGKVNAKLSEQGKRSLWEAKHGSTPYPGDQTSTASQNSTTSNQQKADADDNATFAQRTMQVQSISGLTEDRFQITGEWQRDDGNRVLISNRFERTRIESLQTFSIRVTIAQEWILDHFHLRVGGGPQYAMISGEDLDGEKIKTAGFLPAADLALYWLF